MYLGNQCLFWEKITSMPKRMLLRETFQNPWFIPDVYTYTHGKTRECPDEAMFCQFYLGDRKSGK